MILMYHHVAPESALPPSGERRPSDGWNFTISPDAFSTQIGYLIDRGMEVISLDDYALYVRNNRRAPSGKFVITFDDGWRDNFEYALPILRSYGVSATFYIISSTLGEGRNSELYMDILQLKGLLKEGMVLGSHTRNHPDLTSLSPEDLRAEIFGSRQDLRDLLGADIKHFAYPGGSYNSRVISEVENSGYESACTVFGPGVQGLSGMYMLYRDTFSTEFNAFKDRVKLNRVGRSILSCRNLIKTIDYYMK
jgi:peptidoglycan/xylan/chitin deacetylase (PgdA/CDA1 family)